MITYGVADTLGSYLFGYVIKYTGRLPIFILAATMNFGTIIFMVMCVQFDFSLKKIKILTFWKKNIDFLDTKLWEFIFSFFDRLGMGLGWRSLANSNKCFLRCYIPIKARSRFFKLQTLVRVFFSQNYFILIYIINKIIQRESMGFVIAYAYSNFLCVRIKLFLLIFYLTVGMIGYGTIEFRLKNKKNKVSITSF